MSKLTEGEKLAFNGWKESCLTEYEAHLQKMAEKKAAIEPREKKLDAIIAAEVLKVHKNQRKREREYLKRQEKRETKANAVFELVDEGQVGSARTQAPVAEEPVAEAHDSGSGAGVEMTADTWNTGLLTASAFSANEAEL